MAAFFIGELFNSYLLAKFKVRTKGKGLWGRLMGSSAIGSLLDTTIFTVLAFGGTVSSAILINIIVTVYVIKMLTELLLSPLTIKIIDYIKNKEKIDTFESPKIF